MEARQPGLVVAESGVPSFKIRWQVLALAVAVCAGFSRKTHVMLFSGDDSGEDVAEACALDASSSLIMTFPGDGVGDDVAEMMAGRVEANFLMSGCKHNISPQGEEIGEDGAEAGRVPQSWTQAAVRGFILRGQRAD